MHWFLNLPPGEQLALVVQAVWAIFGAGSFYATVRFLSQRVKKVESHQEEQDAKIQGHGEQIAVHGEQIEALRAAGRGR